MPPMQISALEPATAQRVAKLRSSISSTTTATPLTSRTPSTSSRFTAQTVSSMHKQSDASLRTRNQLPTIAGSPSVGTITKEHREPSCSSINTVSGLPKETPTKIPRISSAASAVPSPPLKHSSSALATRRVSGLASTSANPSPTGLSTSEFGVINDDGTTPKSSVHQSLMRGSPSTSTSRLPRQMSANMSNGSILPRKSNRDSMSFIGLRKPSSGSVASFSTPATNAEQQQSSSSHRFSALSPSKGLKLLGPKPSLRSTNSSNSQVIQASRSSPSSSRQSLSTPSPVPSTVDEEEILGDEEMRNYIKRQQAKRLAAGATQEELDEMLKFPEPIAPAPALLPDSKFLL
ncbi:hypothetical protein AN958_08187 [Leucoagaricus sp. SymC.cos]|nr:hypothetical protein AN958_08187 [Leucoagaricus sp. SymC.cos]